MNVSQLFTASLTSPTVPDLYAVQGDDGRTVVAQLYAGIEPWTVPEGVTGLISYQLPDGTSGCYRELTDGRPGCVIEGNQVTAVIAPVLCRNPGVVEAVIVLRKEDQQISTFPFRIHVTAQPGSQAPESGSDAVSIFAWKLFYGDANGRTVPLEIGNGLTVRDGRLEAFGKFDENYEGKILFVSGGTAVPLALGPGLHIQNGVLYLTGTEPGLEITLAEDGTLMLQCSAELDAEGTIVLGGHLTLDQDGTIMLGGSE